MQRVCCFSLFRTAETLPGRVIPIVKEYRHLGLWTMANIAQTWRRQGAIAGSLTRMTAGRLCSAGIRDMSRGVARIGLLTHLWPRAEFGCGLSGRLNDVTGSRATEAALAAGVRVCMGVNAANQYALDEVVLCLSGTLLFEARVAHYRLRLLFGMLITEATSMVRRALRMQRALVDTSDDVAVKSSVWWYHTMQFLQRLAPHAALEGVPSLVNLVTRCLVDSAAANVGALCELDCEWVKRVSKRFNQELLEQRMQSHRSLDGTRTLLLSRLPVFMRQLHGRRDFFRVLALCGPRAWIPHADYFAGAAEFASLTTEQARLANPRRVCPFCRLPGPLRRRMWSRSAPLMQ